MNIKEIAQIAGVSPSTVSKVLNHKDSSIRPETRERVLKIAKEYHYTPYGSALSSQKTWVLGILLSVSTSLDMTLNGIIQTAQKNGYATLVCNSYSSMEQELKNLTTLIKNNVDAIIWEPVCEQSLNYKSYLQEKNLPFLVIGEHNEDTSNLISYHEFSYCMTQELLHAKHQQIACILTEGRQSPSFLEGYKRCLFDHQITLNEDFIFYDFSDALLYQIKQHQISGFICSHYQKALEFYQWINSFNYRIPEDFSLIVLKTDISETLTYPELSTYTVSKESFGSYLCEKLIAELENSSPVPQCFSQDFILDNYSTIRPPHQLSAKKITVVGSINIDTYLNVASLPHSGKTVSTSTSAVYPGGKGINQAVGAAKLGQRVTLIGNVGSDLDADLIYHALNEYGIETHGVKRCNQVDTGKAYIFVENSGNSMISILDGANHIFTPEDIQKNEHLFQNTIYCLIQSEIPLDTVYQACMTAHKFGAKTILKPSACNSLSESLLKHVDILVPNEDELNELCASETLSLEEKTTMLLNLGAKTIIVTLGDKGCYAKTRNWEEYFPATTFPSIDNTGASDAFISAFAAYLMNGYDLKKSIQIASYAAGFCISREGVVPSLIDKNTLESYIKQQNPDLLR